MAKKLGERLVEAGLLTADKVEQALQQQKITGHKFGDCLVELGLCGEAELLRFLAAELNTRFVTTEKLSKVKIPSEVLDRVPVRTAEARLMLPIAVDNERRLLSVVAAEPQDEAALREIERVAEVDEVYAYIALRQAVQAGIKKHYYGDKTAFSALESGGNVLRADVSPGQAASDTSSGSHSISGRIAVETDPRLKKSGTQLTRHPTQLRDALQAVRGTVADSDFAESLNIMVGLLEMARKELRGHSAQVARQAATVARRLGLPPRELNHVQVAAYLHDLGKPRDRHLTIANFPVTPEWKVDAKRYYRAPIKLFETVNLPPAVNTILAQVYETYDGSGTPQGARGDDITIGARILAAVDSYLDLTKNVGNAFGKLFSKAEAIAFMREQSGKLFDPAVVDSLARLVEGELLRTRLKVDGRELLFAEPDERTRIELTDALSAKGLLAHPVAGLEGVLDSLVAGEADLLIVSLRFGMQDLLGITEYLRGRPETAALPIAVLGEPQGPEAKESLAQAGVNAVIPLPLDGEVAATVVARLLEARVGTGAPARPVRGNLDEVPVLELLRVFAAGKKSGRLSLRALDGRNGALHFEGGRAVHATLANSVADAALTAILGLQSAEFTFDPDALLMELPQLDKDLAAVAQSFVKPGA